MASRAVWKGQLRLSLVAIPVEIHPATQSGARVSFRQIHGPTGKRIRYEKVVPGIGPVDTAEIMKGYETPGGDIVLIDPDEIDAIKLETKKTLELVQFVGACEISPLWYDRPYYIVPTDDLAEDAYRVVRDALRRAAKVGLGQLTMRGREYLCAIRPCGDGLLLETLHYADEVRSADPLFSDIQDDAPDEDLLGVATQLIDRKTAPFDADAFKDHYDIALRELLERKTKAKGTRRVARDEAGESKPSGENVIDLMDALKKSLAGSGKAAAPSKGKPATKGDAGPANEAPRKSVPRKAAAKKAEPEPSKPASRSGSRKRA